jgi:hypothetical protein
MIIKIMDIRFLPEDERQSGLYFCDLLNRQLVQKVSYKDVKKINDAGDSVYICKNQKLLHSLIKTELK